MASRFAKDDPKAAACIEALIKVLADHGFSLSHEDGQGGFILEERGAGCAYNERWLREAFLERKQGEVEAQAEPIVDLLDALKTALKKD